jgi:hypothetical protein
VHVILRWRVCAEGFAKHRDVVHVCIDVCWICGGVAAVVPNSRLSMSVSVVVHAGVGMGAQQVHLCTRLLTRSPVRSKAKASLMLILFRRHREPNARCALSLCSLSRSIHARHPRTGIAEENMAQLPSSVEADALLCSSFLCFGMGRSMALFCEIGSDHPH